MSAMEQSLRRALDAGDSSDPAFRETIYAASERALERMLVARPVDEAAADLQRIRLAETINRVEQDYYVAPSEGEDEALSVEDRDRSGDFGEAAFDGQPSAPIEGPHSDPLGRGPADGSLDEHTSPLGREDESLHEAERGAAPAAADPEAPAFLTATSPDPRLREKPVNLPMGRSSSPEAKRGPVGDSGFGKGARPGGRRFVVFLLVILAAFAVLGSFVYGMVYGSDSDVPAGAAVTSDAGGVAGVEEEGTWIDLFDGTQLASIATPDGGRVETVSGTGERPAVRLTSAGEGSEIEIAVGAGVVGELAGKTVRVEVTVGSPDGQPREFGVRCPFDGETLCGRQRFTTVQSSEAFVFDLSVPAGARRAGSIAFDPGFGTEAKALDLYGVRARVPERA